MSNEAHAELMQARALMEATMSPLARRVESALQSELDAIGALPRGEARKRIALLFDQVPDLHPAPGMARHIVHAGGTRLVSFLARRLGQEGTAIQNALTDYVVASERFLEPVLLRHLPGR